MRTAISRAVGMACLVTATACSLIKVNGKPLGGGAKSSGSAPATASSVSEPVADGEPRASAAKPTVVVSAAKPLALSPDFGPNPLVVAGTGNYADKSIMDLHGDNRSSCQGYVTAKPTAVFDIEQAMDEVQLIAPHADVLFIRQGTTYRCDVPISTSQLPTVSLAGWSGEVEVFVGKNSIRTSVDPTLTIEDMTRPRSLPWLEGAPEIALKAAPKSPKVISIDVPALAKTPAGVSECRGFRFREEPDLAVRVEQSILNLSVTARAAHSMQIMWVGPIPDDHRNIPASCYPSNSFGLGRIEPGLYVLKIGTKEGEETPASLVLRHEDAPRDPLLLAEHIADSLDFEELPVANHFPMLEEDDVWEQDSVRQGLFARAPAALFVFPKVDLDAERAGFESRVGVSADSRQPDDSTVEYPRANEPLLMLRPGTYIAADGNIFKIHANDLSRSPGGAVWLPAKARNPDISFGYSANSARVDGTKAEKALLDKSARAHEAYLDCDERIWKPVNRKLKAIEDGPYSEARQRRINTIEETTRETSYTKCNKPYDKKIDAIWAKLITARTTRRTAALAPLRKRLSKLLVDD